MGGIANWDRATDLNVHLKFKRGGGWLWVGFTEQIEVSKIILGQDKAWGL
jgi:hypothetical protein